MKKINDISGVVGNTPLIKIENIYAKLETTNPTGSIKDRMVWHMIGKAERKGDLKKGSTIIEVTSGNTGISFAMAAAVKGYRFIAVMPESMSIERRKMIKAFGGEIVLTPAKEDMDGAVKKYEELVKKNKNAWLPKQFENQDNADSHFFGTAKEIIEQTGGRIDAFVAGTGTGGTLIGIGKALKAKYPKVKIFGIEPAESPIISKGKSGIHKIQGIGEGFVPALIEKNSHLIDGFLLVKSQEALNMKEKLAKKYGVFTGISSGANVFTALKLAKKYKTVVTVLPDRGERYLSEDCSNIECQTSCKKRQ